MIPVIQIGYQPAHHGWLDLRLTVNGQVLEIDASDVPNNPVQELVSALELSSAGTPASVWWHLEPAGYFMHFTPEGETMTLRIDFSNNSKPAHAQTVLKATGRREHILMPFWRFVREFQSRGFQEPHWPETDYSRMADIKLQIKA